MWALVSVSFFVLTSAIDVACLGPREGEVPMGGIEFPRHKIMVVPRVARVVDMPPLKSFSRDDRYVPG